MAVGAGVGTGVAVGTDVGVGLGVELGVGVGRAITSSPKSAREGLLSDLAVDLFQLMRPLKRAHGLLRLQTEFTVHVPVQIAQIVKPLLHQPHVVALQPAHQNALAEVRRVHFLRRHDRRRPCGFGRRRLGLRRKRKRQQQGRAQSGEVSIVHVSSSV